MSELAPLSLNAQRDVRELLERVRGRQSMDADLPDDLEEAARSVGVYLRDGQVLDRVGHYVFAYRSALQALAHLARWDPAVRAAEVDADRFLRATHREAQVVLDRLDPTDPLHAPLHALLARIGGVTLGAEIPGLLDDWARLPLPVEFVPPAARGRTREWGAGNEQPDPSPLAVCLLSIDGERVGDVVILRPNEIHRLEARARLTHWPEWASEAEIRFLTVEPPQIVSVPTFMLARPVEDADGLWSVEGAGSLSLHAVQRPGADPFQFAVAVTLVGGDRREPVEAAGYQQLRVRTFDPVADFVTGVPSLDARVHELIAEIEDAVSVEDRAAFARFLGAHVRVARSIQADRLYYGQDQLDERTFHDELERRLRADPALEGRLTRHETAGGGYTDLVHDRIVSELKVEDGRPVTWDDVPAYVGQPTQYASSAGSPLSILCILDASGKEAPVGVLENYLRWFVPRLHGLDDPAYPSRVAVLIINAALPAPSDWARQRVDPA